MIFRAMFKSFRIPVAVLLMMSVPASFGQSQDRSISIGVGEFKAVTVENDITRVAVDKPQIADYTVTSKHEILINGNRAGRTAIKIWTALGQITYTVDVVDSRKAKAGPTVDPTAAFNEKIQKILHNPDIAVSRTDRGVVISGYVSTAAEKEKAEKVVKAYMLDAKEDVTNVLDIRKKPRQVKLKIRLMDVSEKATKTYGISWGAFQQTAATAPVVSGALRDQYIMAGSATKTGSAPRILTPFRKSEPFTAVDPFMAQIQSLIDSGVIKLLSAPDIVALSGSKTEVVIGGQIPVPSSSSSGGTTQTSIEWRDYGIKMSLEPNIVEQTRVTAKIYVQLSSLDNANAITISGSLIPAMRVTQASSEINVEVGRTIFLSGLKQEKNTRNVVGIPYLSEIPGVGGLFGIHTKGVEKSDIIISVTAEIIDEAAE